MQTKFLTMEIRNYYYYYYNFIFHMRNFLISDIFHVGTLYNEYSFGEKSFEKQIVVMHHFVFYINNKKHYYCMESIKSPSV